MYGTDPFSAQHATGDAHRSGAPSIFGALPYPRSASVDPPLDSLVTFQFASAHGGGRPTVLNSTVVGPNNEAVYCLASTTTSTTTGALVVTMLNAVRANASSLSQGQGHTVALVEWRSQPTVEIRGVAAKQPAGQWLRLSSDRRSRIMAHGGIHYSWAPVDRFLQLFAPGSQEWLARVTKHYDTVVLELTTRAIQCGLLDVVILATALLQSGRSID